ncbi:hypothetical protein CPT_Mater203 [Bacillus phage Mater]|uniref:SGNH hydrolase-type esterase domain-containing protein n=1 Tax=Bacillus phage Mater TaxID=1540090 RepID=A0A0A0RMR5_9CAUD|nr:tail protein [Bacillus phage Mater]AIW03360.1 hypothetical protein CPT_Mater203 [Bacillus phage Mater]
MLLKRGLKKDLPTLLEGEMGLATDTKELYIGSANGNVKIAGQGAVDALAGNTQAAFDLAQKNNGQIGDLSKRNGAFGYNLNNALFNYRIALSNASNQIVKVDCIGDSITRGEYSSDEPSKSWVAILRKNLQAKYGNDPGEGFINSYEGGMPAGSNPRWTRGAGWSSLANGRGGFMINSNGNTTPSTVTFKGDSVTLLFSKTTDGGKADILIDGVNKGIIDCYATATDFTPSTTYTGLGAGTHVMTITPQTTARLFIEGVIENSGATKGIQVNRLGISGRKTSEWLDVKNRPRLETVKPHLAIISLGMNDVKTIDEVTFKTNLGDLIKLYQSYGASVVVNAYFQPSSSWVTSDKWDSFLKVMYELADELNVGLIDIYNAFGKSYTLAQSKGLFGPSTNDYTGNSGTNSAHPGDKGYAYIGHIVSQYLV